MQIWINGQNFLLHGTTVKDVLSELKLAEQGIAIAVNDRVIARSHWSLHLLDFNDRITIIYATAGG